MTSYRKWQDVKVLACALRRVQSAGAPSGLDLGYNSITDEGLWHLSEWIKVSALPDPPAVLPLAFGVGRDLQPENSSSLLQ